MPSKTGEARYVECLRCGYGKEGHSSWITRKVLPDQPIRCASCRSPYWSTEPRSGITVPKK